MSLSPSLRVPSSRAPVHILGLQGTAVVIVDDQETARLALDEVIRGIDPGISTVLFANGLEALGWLEQHEADLIITDYRMPGMTGVQFTKELRRSRQLQHVPVMVVTAADDRAVRYAALEAGAVDFPAKPIDPLEVRTRCRNLLLLTPPYPGTKNYSLLQESKLDRPQHLLGSLAGGSRPKFARRGGVDG